MMPAVATSFKVTLPVADKFGTVGDSSGVAVAAKVPVTAPCNAKAASLVIAVFSRCGQDYIRIRFQSIQSDAGGRHIVQGNISGG